MALHDTGTAHASARTGATRLGGSLVLPECNRWRARREPRPPGVQPLARLGGSLALPEYDRWRGSAGAWPSRGLALPEGRQRGHPAIPWLVRQGEPMRLENSIAFARKFRTGHSTGAFGPRAPGYQTSLAGEIAYNISGTRRLPLSRDLRRGPWCIQWASLLLSLDLGRGKWNVAARSRAGTEGRVESYLLRSFPDLGTNFVPLMACGEERSVLCAGTGGGVSFAAVVFRLRHGQAVVLSGVGDRISFREAEAPAEPYTTEKLATRGGSAGASASLRRGDDWLEESRVVFQERSSPSRSLVQRAECVLRVLAMRTVKVGGHEARWRSWAPSWLASHRPSRLALPKPPGCAEPVGSGAPPGGTRGSEEADLDCGYRLSRIRREQSGPEPRAPRASGLWPDRAHHARSGIGVLQRCAGREGRSRRAGAASVSLPTSRLSYTISGPSSHADRAAPNSRRDLRYPGAPGTALLRAQHRRAVGPGARRRLRDGAASARTPFPGKGLRRADGQHHAGNPLGARSDAADRGRRASLCSRSAVVVMG